MQSLQIQLNILKQKQKTEPKLPYGSHCSLLFDFRHINKIELDTLYEIGYEGLLELAKQDETFGKYLKLLFSSTSKYFNRDMIPSNEIKEYDEHLKQLIHALSKYFTTKPAHQVIEYLIKVYQVNLHLCDEMIFSFLCYHSQSVFIKLLQNINFTEHSYWSFIEAYAKNGTFIPKNVIVTYANSDFAFLLRLVSFYIDNIDITNEIYFSFVLDIIKSKISSINSIKAIESNLFQSIIKLINMIHNGYSKIKKKNEERYTVAYTDCMLIVLNKINFASEYLQAIANDSIIKLCPFIESKNSMIGILKFHSLLCSKHHQLPQKSREKLYKVDSLKSIAKKASLVNAISNQIVTEKDIEFIIYELIASADDEFALIKGIVISLFNNQSVIEKVIVLLLKYNQTEQWSSIEDLNLSLFNKAYITLYKQNLITTLVQTSKTNYGLYFDLISSSMAQVLKGIKECDEEIGMEIDESIKTALKSKFDFFADEVILNSIMNMKRMSKDDLNESLLQFYYSIKKGKVNKYSEAFLQSIRKHLDKKVISSNDIYYLYRTVFFNNGKDVKKDKRQIEIDIVIKELIDIIEYQPEYNSQLNQKQLIAYLQDELLACSNNLLIEQCGIIQSLFQSKHLLTLYPLIATSIYHLYLLAIIKSKLAIEHKLPLVRHMLLYSINNQHHFTQSDIDEALISFREKSPSSPQLLLAYILFEEEQDSTCNKVIQYVFQRFHSKKETEIECLLLFALMIHLSSMTNDQIAFFFNQKGKMKISFSSLQEIAPSSNKSTKKAKESVLTNKDQYKMSFNSLLDAIYSNKIEIAINKNYLNRLFASNAIERENLYILLNHLLLTEYNQSYYKTSIKLLSLFTKSAVFDIGNQQCLLSFIQSINNASELECLLLKNFMLAYPQSQFEVMIQLKDKPIPPELIEIFFENGFPISEINSPQILFQVIKFAINNNVSPYMLNICLPQDELINYLNYIIKHSSEIEEKQLVYFFKMIMLMPNNSNTDLILKTIEIINSNEKLNGDININLCYAIYSFSKQLIRGKALNNKTNDIIISISSLFKTLCDSINISNVINYEQEKKIQLLLSVSNYISSIASIDNNLLIDLSQYVNESSSLGRTLKQEIGSIIHEAIIDFIPLIKNQPAEFYFKYIKCIIQYSEIGSSFLKQLSHNDIIMSFHQCEAYVAYHLYSKYSNMERNEILTGFILSEKTEKTRPMFEWMKLIEEVVQLKETNGKTVKDLIGYIIAFILKINNWNNDDSIEKDKDTCTVILNISSLFYPNSSDLIEKLLQFTKKNKLLPSLLIALYSPNESLAINYSKGKNYFLRKLTQLIPIESSDNHYSLLSFILKNVILEGKEKKIENLIFLYQLLTRLMNKKTSPGLLKEFISQIIQQFSFNKINLSQVAYALTISKWLLTVFNLFTMSYLHSFNAFIPLLIKGFNESVSFYFNKDIRNLIVENMELLTHEVCIYLSPFLNELIGALIQFEDIEETKAVLSKIGSKNIFDSSFESVKANQHKINSLLLIYFNSSIYCADGLIIADLGNEVMEHFIAILLSNQNLFESIRECIKSFILKIHGKQLKIIFNELLGKLKAKDDYYQFELKISTIIFQIFNTILFIVKDLFIKNYFVKYKDVAIQLLNTSNDLIFKKNTTPLKLRHKRERTVSDVDDKDNYNTDGAKNEFSYYKLSCLLLENIKMNFKYSKGELLAETIEELYEPVLNQLKLSDSMNEMAKYFEDAVKGCLFEMFKNSKSDELIGKFNEDLLELLREDNYVTRLFVLKTVLHLFETMKERYISFIEEIVQCVSERLEDNNEMVQNEAREVIKCIEKLTGESYATYLE